MSQEAPTVESSVSDVWYLKEVWYGVKDARKPYRIITQNFNGPCSFIAICNILILRGNIAIEPPERRTVSYEFLSHLVAEYLLLCSPDVDVSAALSIMPLTQKGMDLNPVFTSSTEFRPSGLGGELKLFEQVGIRLVHGWLVDPGSQEANALERAPDYDTAVSLIAEVDHLTHGKFVVEEVNGTDPAAASGSSSSSAPAGSSSLTKEQHDKIADAIAVKDFLEHSQSQLTYHGLFQLVAELEPNALVALFRNSHLSVLLKVEDENGPALYTLVTDQVFLRESSVVWERLEDIDGGWSTFVDSEFIKASPAGGDFAGQTAEDALKALEILEQQYESQGDHVDLHSRALAQQLQAEEDYLARRAHEERLNRKQGKRTKHQESGEEVKKEKKKKDCIIM
ncbi:hypothetical protein FA15DRAFT_79169 [Coprinopsis marcescibilis]|uniref:MINDY deubiquitinase domain-containing protein n=1 Tax=Coprinopsis marcescibilis TaxID=230819 RepID=A0A5C3KMD4_COPMA|nr:hypothetical protein FA15DRAFT_79169 [Coprinopsis marcescibilis]